MQVNIIENELLSWGEGWDNYQSKYAGTELGFVVGNTGIVSFKFIQNSSADQGIELIIDGKNANTSKSGETQSVITASIDPKKRHTITIRHYCTYLYDPCDITIKKISIERRGVLYENSEDKPILTVLGDSISTMYGLQNYTRTLSDAIGSQLHNASIMGSSVSQIPKVDSALLRYEKDLKDIHSANTIIFLGTNDVKNDISLDIFYKNYSDMIMNIRKWNAATRIFLVGILPRKDIPSSTISLYNNIIKTIAYEQSATYVDTSDWILYEDLVDDIHPSIEGQKKISSRFENFLREEK